MVFESFYSKHTTLTISVLLNNKHYLTLTKRTNQIDIAYKLCNIFTHTTKHNLKD